MSDYSPAERLEDLLAERALFGLSDADQQELDKLLAEVRIAHKIDWPGDLFVIGIEIDFGEDKKQFNSFIEDWIKNRIKTSAIWRF